MINKLNKKPVYTSKISKVNATTTVTSAQVSKFFIFQGFTGKELDEETNYYYFGARYLDPRTSRWISADPAMADYVPQAPVNDEARKRNGNLPGQGGVFNTINFHVYHYAGNNPVKLVDPNGEWAVKLGISISITVGGGWTASVGIAFGHSKDGDLSVGFYKTVGETQGSPAVGIGATGAYVAKAEAVRDLDAVAEKSLGASISYGGIDISTDENYKLDPASGVSITIGKGLPIPEFHGLTTTTSTVSISTLEAAQKMEKAEQNFIEDIFDKITNPFYF